MFERLILQVLTVQLQLLRIIDRKLDAIMTDQEKLNADVAALVAGLDAVEQEIADLKAGNPAIDFSALDAVVARLQADAPAPPAPPTV